MIRLSQHGGSSSSIYVSEEEEDEIIMEVEREEKEGKVMLGKRKKENVETREASDSETDDRRSRKEKQKRKQAETDKILEDIKRQQQEDKERKSKKAIETEESDEELVEKNAENYGRNEDGRNFESIITEVQNKIKIIVKAVNKENGGKINVTRADQQIVKDSAAGLLNDVIGVVLSQIDLEKRVKEMELQVLKKDVEINTMKRKLRGMGREMERQVMTEETDDLEEGSERGTAKERKATYAEVSKRESEWKKVGKSQKIKGRVVTVGKEV